MKIHRLGKATVRNGSLVTIAFAVASFMTSCAKDEAEQDSGASAQQVRMPGLDHCANAATRYAESLRGRCGNNCVYGSDSDHHAIAVREFARCMACQAPAFRNMYGGIYADFGEFAAWFHENGARSPDWLTDNAANTGGRRMAQAGFSGSRRNIYLRWERRTNTTRGNCGTFEAPFPVSH